MQRIQAIVAALALIAAAFMPSQAARAAGAFAVGERYQVNAAMYPGKLVICVSEAAMDKYQHLVLQGKSAKAERMVFDTKEASGEKRMKQSNGCTRISSSTQADIVQLGISSHKAAFVAYPWMPMWGWYMYFGGRVK